MPHPPQIRLNALDQCTPGFLAFGLWAHERDRALEYTTLAYWLDYARLLERGRFDALFLADILGVPDVYRGGPDAAFATGALAPSLDPAAIVSGMAAVTQGLGFAITGNASHEVPYLFARRMATLDHMTAGRLGWNIVTGFLDSGARACGEAGLMPHDDRYDVADSFMDVTLSLLRESWGEGAVLRDRATGRFADPSRIAAVTRDGPWHRIHAAGPTEPSPQRVPMLFQAGGSPRGRDFAATHAEGIFLNGPKLPLVAEQVQDIRLRAAAKGRDADALRFFAGASIIVAETQSLAEARVRDYMRAASVEGMLTQLSAALGIDLSAYPLDEPIRYQETDAARSQIELLTRKGAFTIRQMAESMILSGRNVMLVGTPSDIADRMTEWMTEGGVHGFNVSRILAHETMEAVVDLLVPELQQRGMFKTDYAPGTLRDKMR